MARALGVSKTAPSATKAFCMSMTIRAQRRGSMVKKFLPVALGLEDMASPSRYPSHCPRIYDIARFAEDQLVPILRGVRWLIPAPACPVPGAPLWPRVHSEISCPEHLLRV